MTQSEEFRIIVQNFRDEISVFLAKHNLDKYSVLVELDEDRPTGRIDAITTSGNKIRENISFLDDAMIILCQSSNS